jgi:hypothetical protein
MKASAAAFANRLVLYADSRYSKRRNSKPARLVFSPYRVGKSAAKTTRSAPWAQSSAVGYEEVKAQVEQACAVSRDRCGHHLQHDTTACKGFERAWRKFPTGSE